MADPVELCMKKHILDATDFQYDSVGYYVLPFYSGCAAKCKDIASGTGQVSVSDADTVSDVTQPYSGDVRTTVQYMAFSVKHCVLSTDDPVACQMHSLLWLEGK